MTTANAEQLALRRLAMLTVVPIGLLLLDARGSVEEANPAASRVLGLTTSPLSLDELHGRVLDPATGGAVDTADLPWHRALRGEHVEDLDLLLAVPSRTERRLITVSSLPFHDPAASAPGALIMVVDRVRFLLRDTVPDLTLALHGSDEQQAG